MAKLSAHNSEVLAQVFKFHAKKESDDQLGVVKSRTTRAFRSDGKILKKYDVWFTDQYSKSGVRQHSYGWKVEGKSKSGLTPEQFVEEFKKIGYTEE